MIRWYQNNCIIVWLHSQDWTVRSLDSMIIFDRLQFSYLPICHISHLATKQLLCAPFTPILNVLYHSDPVPAIPAKRYHPPYPVPSFFKFIYVNTYSIITVEHFFCLFDLLWQTIFLKCRDHLIHDLVKGCCFFSDLYSAVFFYDSLTGKIVWLGFDPAEPVRCMLFQICSQQPQCICSYSLILPCPVDIDANFDSRCVDILKWAVSNMLIIKM